MAYAPEQPFPKTKGHPIKSKDWNDAIVELQRLETAKVNKAGDSVAGQLTVAGNVGLKNTNPQRPLQIGGETGGVGINPSDASPNAGYVRWGDNTGWKLHFGRSKESPSGALNASTAGVLMTLQDNGNVGLGTTSPGAKLQVTGGAIMPAVGNSAAAGIQFPANPGGGGGDEAFIRYFVEGGETTKLLIGNQNDADDRISLYQSGGERLTIYNGNVGVGTDTPNHKFHVVAPDAVGLFESSGAEAFLRLSTNEGINNRVEITNRPGGRLSLWTAGGGDAFNVLKDGKVGIGTTGPGYPLHVVGSHGEEWPSVPSVLTVSDSSNSAKALRLGYNAGLDRAVIAASHRGTAWKNIIINPYGGRVGIGLEHPEVAFHVNGERIRLHDNRGTGRYLDLRADGGALDLEASTDLYINNNGNTVHIKKVAWDSSRTFKENIADFTAEEATEALEGLKPVTFRWKEDEQKTTNLGFIAEDTPDIATMPDKKAIYPLHLLAILSKVMQEQQRMIGHMRRELDLLSGL